MKILIKGAGDLATGIGWRLKRAGYEVWMTDIEVPTSVRRTVAFSRAIYENSAEIEGITAVLAADYVEGEKAVQSGYIPVLVDPKADIIHELKPDKSVYRELCLIKVKSTPEKRQGVIAVADIFRAKIVDVNVDSLIVELTGNQSKIDAFIGLLQDYEILELARTGIAGLGRGTEDVIYLE